MGLKSASKKRRAAVLHDPDRNKETAEAKQYEHSAGHEQSSSKKWLVAGGLVAAVFLAYQPVWHCGFIWDDDDYVTANKTLLDRNGLERIWSDRNSNPQYYPLVHTTFWIEHHLWGLNPLGYHLVNVALHAANVVLLWLVLRRLNVPGAFWAAGLFALHPVMVESVAWVTERKNVLSALFYLCSFWSLLCFWPPERAVPRPDGRWRYYFGALALFAAALFSKTVACSLPAAFLLIRWWKLGRLTRRDLWVTAPFFALGLALALNTAALEKHQVGASGKDWDFSAIDRMLIAGRALWFYAGSLVWPAQLTFIYPRWQIDAQTWWQYLFPLAAIGIIGTLWALRGRLGRGPLTAVLFFAGTLVPALGFFNVYPMRYSFVADHFQYLASLGLLALAGVAVEFLRSRLAANVGGLVAAGCWTVLAVLAVLTWRQVGVYKDLVTLWTDTLAKNPTCWMAQNNLGLILFDRGQFDEGTALFWDALRMKPDYGDAHYNLGLTLAARGQMDEAIDHYQKAVQLRPDFYPAHNNLGAALAARGKFEEAIAEYRTALELKPDEASAHQLFAMLLVKRGQTEEALDHFRKALLLKPDFAEAYDGVGTILAGRGQINDAIANHRKALQLKPDFAEAYYNLANLYSRLEKFEEADVHYQKTLEIKPDYAEAYFNHGNLYAGCKKFDEAISRYEQAVKFKPDFADAHNNLGVALAPCGRLSEALDSFRKAVEFKPDFAEAHDALGNALANLGNRKEALDHYRKALALARSQNKNVLAETIRGKLKEAGDID